MKVALVFVCVNKLYWPYSRQIMEDCRRFFLSGHQVDIFLWSDMPEGVDYGATLTHVDKIQWPMGTLFRYHLFLQKEEELAKYDYIFYMDVDMRVVDKVGEEILGEGLTMVEHPMYAIRKELVPPYEPSNKSEAYIPRPGFVYNDEQGKPRFKPTYAAGGFQGGKAKVFIEAMKVMKGMIDKDFQNNYIAIWNDESHWNKYLFEHNPTVVLCPSYCYPDSLINEYYVPIWGKNYPPKIITLTKPFTLKKGGAADALAMAQQLSQMKI